MVSFSLSLPSWLACVFGSILGAVLMVVVGAFVLVAHLAVSGATRPPVVGGVEPPALLTGRWGRRRAGGDGFPSEAPAEDSGEDPILEDGGGAPPAPRPWSAPPAPAFPPARPVPFGEPADDPGPVRGGGLVDLQRARASLLSSSPLDPGEVGRARLVELQGAGDGPELQTGPGPEAPGSAGRTSSGARIGRTRAKAAPGPPAGGPAAPPKRSQSTSPTQTEDNGDG